MNNQKTPQGLNDQQTKSMLALAVECHAGNDNYDIYTLRDGRVLLKYINKEGGILYASQEQFKAHIGRWPSKDELGSNVSITMITILIIWLLLVAIIVFTTGGGDGEGGGVRHRRWHRWGHRR